MGSNPTTFVSSDHGFGAQFLAIYASLPFGPRIGNSSGILPGSSCGCGG